MDNGEQFDKYIKATIESGSEDVPAGLWDGIQARMAADAPASEGFSWWKRVLTGVALAGIVATAVVLFVPKSGIPDVQETVAEAVIEEEPIADPETAADIMTVAEPLLADAHPAIKSGPATAKTEGKAAAITKPDEATIIGMEPIVTEAAEVEPTEVEPVVTVAQKSEPAAQKSEPAAQALLFDDEKPQRSNRFELAVNTNGAENIGGHSYGDGRMSTSQMSFGQNETLTETEATNYLIPISTGISVRYNFNEKWALSIGVNYTYLNRHFKAVYDYGGIENFQCDNVNNDQHYVGIPINAFYTVYSDERIKFYVNGGGAIEKCVNNKYSFAYTAKNNKVIDQSVAGFQTSINVGLGIQVNITGNFGIYLDPSFRYYFKNYLQPKSIRTVQPIQIGAELGLRWDL